MYVHDRSKVMMITPLVYVSARMHAFSACTHWSTHEL